MLRHTFQHFGISPLKERKLWNNGIIHWDDWGCGAYIDEAKTHLEKKNHEFFSSKLPLNEHWRAYECFKNKCCFLDIETTGLSKETNKITTIGLYDGRKSRVFVRHKDIDEFQEVIKNYSMIVTYNGRCFDLPFIKTKYPSIEFKQFHCDLRFVLRKLGYTGGLKRIEKNLGITRDDEIADVDGYEAVMLWGRYRRGDESALQKLIDYNIADIENLKTIMEMVYKKMSLMCMQDFAKI